MKSFQLLVWFIGYLALILANDQLPDDPYMSYLHFPHLHFFGKYVVDAATANNYIKHYDMDKFTLRDALPTREGGQGYWNPTGTNNFMLKDTSVTNVCYADGKCTSDKNEDPISGKTVTDGGYGSFAKMVDIDPMGQVVPEIWGFKIKIPGFFVADFIPTPLSHFWPRQVNVPGDMGKGGWYQTVLKNIEWEENRSPFIEQIQQVMHNLQSKELSIKLFLDTYAMNYTSPNFTTGRLIGTIGVSGPKAPTVSTWGRHMLTNVNKFTHNALFIIDKKQKQLIVELENSIPLDNNGFPIQSKDEKWYIAYSKTAKEAVNCTADFVIIGNVNVTDIDWFEKFAGIKWFSLTDKQISDLESSPLLLLVFNGTYNKQNTSNCIRVLLKEPFDGIWIQPYHNWVHRKDAGEHIRQKVFVTKFGKPHANAKIDLTDMHETYDSVAETYLKCGFPKLPLPNTSIRTKSDGIAEIIMQTIDPKNIRRIIDGQAYAHYYTVNGSELQKKQQKCIYKYKLETYGDDGTICTILDFMVFTRIYDNYTVSNTVNWVEHIYPIFYQYAYLFPVMRSSTFKMDSYFDVVAHKSITSLSLRLPINHPSYMPSTRDLSKKKRKVILDWLDKEDPPIGDVTKLISVRYLTELVHSAIDIIHSSIPVYFTALWSLKYDYNREIQTILKTIIEQEILHLGLMINILTAIGGKLRIPVYSSFFLKYPSILPDGIQPSIQLSLDKFSKSLLKNVLIKMKKPDYNILDVGFRKVLFDHEVSFRSLCVNRKVNQQSSNKMKLQNLSFTKSKLQKSTSSTKNKLHKSSSAKTKLHKSSSNKPKLHKSSFTKKEGNCNRDKQTSNYIYHLSYCRAAVKQYLSTSINTMDNIADKYVDAQNKDFFKYRSSVGKFYSHILLAFAKLTDCGTKNMQTDPANLNDTFQVDADQLGNTNLDNGSYLRLFQKHIFKIDSYFDVIKAMRLILYDNQGITPCNPRTKYDKQSQEFTENDFSTPVNGFSDDSSASENSFSDDSSAHVNDISDDSSVRVNDLSDDSSARVNDFSDDSSARENDISDDSSARVNDFSDDSSARENDISDDSSARVNGFSDNFSARVNGFSQYAMLMAISKGQAPVVVTSPDGQSNWPGSKGDQKYIKKICDGKTYEFHGSEIPFNESAVWPIISNPSLSSLTNSDVTRTAGFFSKLYLGFLNSFIQLCTKPKYEINVNNSNPGAKYPTDHLRDPQNLLAAAEYYGRKLVQMPLTEGGNPEIGPNAAPLYKFYYLKDIDEFSQTARILMKFNYNVTAAIMSMKPTPKPSRRGFPKVELFDASTKMENNEHIESILEINEDPLTLAIKKKQKKKIYMTWSDLQNELDSTNDNESNVNDKRDEHFQELDEDPYFPLRIDSLN